MKLVSGVHEVDATWFAGELASMSQLVGCDDAAFVPYTSGSGFQVVNASSGEFMYLIGLRNGDRPVSLNGMALTSFADAYEAFELYLEGVTSYTLVVLRGTSNVTLYISLV